MRRTPHTRWAALAGAAVLLSACAGSPREIALADGDSQAASQRTQIASAARGAPARPVVPPSAQDPEDAPTARLDPIPDEREQLEEMLAFGATPRDLMGAGVGDVAAVLGRPTLVRAERPSEIWQYRVADCVLDVFLRDQGDGLLVDHVEGRDRGGAEVDAESCMDRVVSAKEL